MVFRATVCVLACSLPAFCITPAERLASAPLGFERSGAGYTACVRGGAVTVDSGGMTFGHTSGSARVSLSGSHLNARISAEDDAGIENRFIGSDPAKWRTGVPLYRTVRVTSVYPGIDLTYYGTGRQLEYDFLVAAGADPRRIQMRVGGATRVALKANGDLRIGDLIERRPVAYQQVAGKRRHVESRFVLHGGRLVGFALGEYDRAAPLTIDPVIVLSSYAGGGDADELHAVTVDSSGNLYVAGLTYSTAQSNSHVMLLKVPPSGTPTSSIFGGTTGNDGANAVATDASGNVYLAGYTSSSDFPPLGNTFACTGTQDAFLISLSPANTAVNFSTCMGGSGSDNALALVLAPNNLVYVAGETNSFDFPAVSTSFQPSNHGGYDAFFAVFSTAGVFSSATYLGGSSDDHAYGLAVDTAGYAYIVGSTASTDFILTPPPGFQTGNQGGSDAFALKINSAATLGQYFTYIGGSGSDVANSAALDAAGNLYVAGTTASQNFPVTSSAYQTTYQGGQSDGFVFALAPGGLQGVWSTYVGSAGDDLLNGITLDASANVYVAGSTTGSAFSVTTDAAQPKLAGSQDAILVKLAGNLETLQYGSFLGGTLNDLGTAVALDGAGNVFVVGITSSTDFPVTSGAHQTTYGGGISDGFYAVSQFSSTPPAVNASGVVNAASFAATPVSPGSIISIFGTDFATAPAQAAATPLPVTLGNVSATVNNVSIPLYYVNQTQINAQLPYETTTGTASLIVTGPSGTSVASSFTVVPAAPGVFVASGQAVVENQDNSLNTPSNGAKAGSVVVIYFTGQGTLDNPVTTGAVAPNSPLSNVTLSKSATIGGQSAQIGFMGLTPGLVGLAQANVTVPPLSAGSYPVVLTINGVASAAATMTVASN